MLHVIGIGSPFGEDDLGWRIIERLRHSETLRPAANQLTFERSDRPGAALLALLDGKEEVVLIDAMVSGALPGTLRCFRGDEIATARGLISSHGFGVVDALALAGVLGQLPPRLLLLGVEIAPPEAPLALASHRFEEVIAEIEFTLIINLSGKKV